MVPCERTISGDPDVLEEALDRIDELVVKPRAGYGGDGVVICPHAERDDVERVRGAVQAAPEDFIAQELVRRCPAHPPWSTAELVPAPCRPAPVRVPRRRRARRASCPAGSRAWRSTRARWS